jgi:O6-methylguanine-DNA--protein-cysteine methyltransferase
MHRLIQTPIGMMVATTDENAIIALDFSDLDTPVATSNHPLLVLLEKELCEYFKDQRREFTLPLNPQGTPFQKEVWKTLQTIPYATTISYAQEAKLFGNPKAIRAVASANGKNPISILIPCQE